ncbi:unnamed protein product [Phytophthora lilii]|uniref:Unnamed protein product n=1 Tax=Phytophthora lilii TaxID=2077276 RepID=A0A9W6WYD2_9STRA|nr:unnamed protein product [Phytophthora lilii]
MIHYYYAKIAYSCCTSRTSKVEVAMLLESMLLVVQGRVKKATWWSAGKPCLRCSKRSLWLSADTFHTSEVAYWTAAPKLSLGGEGGVHLLAACSLCIAEPCLGRFSPTHSSTSDGSNDWWTDYSTRRAVAESAALAVCSEDVTFPIPRGLKQFISTENFTVGTWFSRWSLQTTHDNHPFAYSTTNPKTSLSVVQRFVHHYISLELGGSDVMATVRRAVQDAGLTGQEDETDAFTFAWRTDGVGMPVVGNGSDSDPFVLGISTKKLLRQADRDPSTFVLHVDATYKLAQVGYPVIVVSITDRARRFHLLAMFIVSHQQQPQFTEVLSLLLEFFRRLLETTPRGMGNGRRRWHPVEFIARSRWA